MVARWPILHGLVPSRRLQATGSDERARVTTRILNQSSILINQERQREKWPIGCSNYGRAPTDLKPVVPSLVKNLLAV